MSKFKCNKCNNNCIVALDRGTPANCVLDNDAPCWHEEITLSPKVFKLPDCPEWANYAASDPDGNIWVYETEPKYVGDRWHNTTGRFINLISVYTDGRDDIMVQKEATPILLTDKIKPGDWIYQRLNERYEQVTELKGITVRTVKYFKGQRKFSDWHVDQINGYFSPDPIEVKPIPEWEAHKLVGKVIQDVRGNTELVMAWSVDRRNVYIGDYRMIGLEDLTSWWLGDRPCGVIESEDSCDANN